MNHDIAREIIRAAVTQPSAAWAAIPQVCRKWQELWREELLAAARGCRLPPRGDILQCSAATRAFMAAACSCSCTYHRPCQCAGRGEDWTWYLGGAVDQCIIDEIQIINDPRQMCIGIGKTPSNNYFIARYQYDGDAVVYTQEPTPRQYPNLSPEVFAQLLARRRIDRAWLTNLVRDRPGLALQAWIWQEPNHSEFMFRLYRWTSHDIAETRSGANLYYSRPYLNADVIASPNSLIDEYNSFIHEKHIDRGDTMRDLFRYITTHTISMIKFSSMVDTDYTRFASLNPGDQRLLIFNRLVGMYGSSPQFAIIFIVIAALVHGTETLSADFIELITNTAVIRGNDRFYSCLHAILAMDAAGAFGSGCRIGRPRPDGPRWPLKVSSRGFPYYSFVFIYCEMFGDAPPKCIPLYTDILSWVETGAPQPSADYFAWLFRHCIDHVVVNHSNIITEKQYNHMRDVASGIVGSDEWYNYVPWVPRFMTPN